MSTHTLLPENIHPLTDFLRHHKRHLKSLKRSQRPIVLTLNGKAKVVVQDAQAYQAMLEAWETNETKKGVAEGIASMENGESASAQTVFNKLRKKHGFKGSRK